MEQVNIEFTIYHIGRFLLEIFGENEQYELFNFTNAGQYIAVIGGTQDHETILSEVEVIRISDEGVVFSHLSNCNLPELKVQKAAVSNNMICGGETPDTTNQCQELNPESLKWENVVQ